MKLQHCLPLLAPALLCGCLQVEDQLTLEPDGSGTVRLEVRSALPEGLRAMMTMGSPFGRGAGGNSFYPPASEAEARQWFPAQDFVVKATEQDEGEEQEVVIEASFKDLNKLLASPYGRAHQLELKVDGGALKLRAMSGGETVARALTLKAEGDWADMLPTGGEDLGKNKDKLKFRFRVTLPGAVTESSGARDGRAATWAVERAAVKDDEEFATKLGGVLTASCAAEGVKFSPVTPPRLALGAFGEIAAGKFAGATSLPDTNQVAAAVKFVPDTLQVTRAVDLSGESGGDSQATLTGAIVLPAALAPPQWGQPKLTEVLDAKGKSLLPKEDGDELARLRRYSRYSRYGHGDLSEEEDEEGSARKQASDEARHEISLSFLAPDWKVKSLKRLKAVVPMQYLSGAEVVKLSNAVPASLVMDMSKRASFNFGGDERGAVEHPRLTELGMTVRVQSAMSQGPMTMLALAVEGGKLVLTDAQVYDADGKPWPTTLVQQSDGDEEERTAQIMVTGKPKAPFSLALTWGGVGATVEAQVKLENIPLTAN